MAYVAVLDCGSSAVKAMVFDDRGVLHGTASKKTPGIFSGDTAQVLPEDLSRVSIEVLAEAVKSQPRAAKKIEAVAVTNQRASVVPVSATGDYLHPVIGWMDMRGCDALKDFYSHFSREKYYDITGLPCEAIFSLAKLLWLQKERPEIWAETRKLLFVDGLMLRELGCEEYITDATNASVTGLMDTEKGTWSREILSVLGLERRNLPRIVRSGQKVGRMSSQAAAQCGIRAGVPLIDAGGDQQCSAMGAGAMEPGNISVTLGTASVAVGFCGTRIKDERMRVLTTRSLLPGLWACEGFQNSAISSLRWLLEHLFGEDLYGSQLLAAAGYLEAGCGGFFFPFLGGSASPDWRNSAKAGFFGLDISLGREHLLRAVFEGIAFQNRRIFDVFRELGIECRHITLAGGGSRIKEWDQIQADIYDIPTSSLECVESTGMGAAIMALHTIGEHASVEEGIAKMVRLKNDYIPEAKNVKIYNELYKDFCERAELS